jgi:hypothetical protein
MAQGQSPGVIPGTSGKGSESLTIEQLKELAMTQPVAEEVQSDGRIRRWVWIAAEERYLRVVLLVDGQTVHNAFFDRRFAPGRVD